MPLRFLLRTITEESHLWQGEPLLIRRAANEQLLSTAQLLKKSGINPRDGLFDKVHFVALEPDRTSRGNGCRAPEFDATAEADRNTAGRRNQIRSKKKPAFKQVVFKTPHFLQCLDSFALKTNAKN